jgi:hypothetical protein
MNAGMSTFFFVEINIYTGVQDDLANKMIPNFQFKI